MLIKNLSKETLENAVKNSNSFVDVCNKLGYDDIKNKSILRNITRQIYRNNISVQHFSSLKRCKKDRYNKEVLLKLVLECSTMGEILYKLDVLPINSNYITLKKYFKKHEINYDKFLNENKIRHSKTIYKKETLEPLVKSSTCINDVCKKLNLSTKGNNFKTIKKYIKLYDIDISHFNPNKIRGDKLRLINTIKLDKILIRDSSYLSTSNLKKRLYKEGLKERKCEICGQDENWHGKHMSLILDHINGISNDNRIENLRIVCPNCNATLETHCRGKNTLDRLTNNSNKKKEKRLEFFKSRRKVERPSIDILLNDVTEMGYSATGRKYGVSDNAIRKWIKNTVK